MLRYFDISERDMKLFDMNVETWEECTLQHSLWREKVTTGTRKYQQVLLQRKEMHRQERKQSQMSRDADDDNAYICKHCRSRISLYSHMRTHQT